MKKYLLSYAFLSFFIFSNDYAKSLSTWKPVVILGAGAAATSSLGSTQDFPIVNPVTDQFYSYSPQKPMQAVFMLNGFLGGERKINSDWFLQTGLNYNQMAAFTAKGIVTQGADQQSADSFNYQYRVTSRQLLAEGKLFYSIKQSYHPYILVDLGVAFNRAFNFSTNIATGLTFTRIYQNNSTTSFSYAGGLGMDIDVDPHIRFGVGYRFSNLGKVKLGDATINTTPATGTLSQSHWYANEALAQLTFIL